MLPILTFDENKLRPSYGYFFDRSWLAPYETIVGIAWKFAKMNVLPGHVVAQQLSATPTDPYEGFAPILPNIDVRALATNFAIPKEGFAGQHRISRNQPPHERLPSLLLTVHGLVISRNHASACRRDTLSLPSHTD